MLQLLNDGISIRAVSRTTTIDPKNPMKLVWEAGRACLLEHHRRVSDLSCAAIQVDGIWGFVAQRGLRIPLTERGQRGRGDVWTLAALNSGTRLPVAWLKGTRDGATAAYLGRLDPRRCRSRDRRILRCTMSRDVDVLTKNT